jgi:hypothetical protein
MLRTTKLTKSDDPQQDIQARRGRAVETGSHVAQQIHNALTLGDRTAAHAHIERLDLLFDVVEMADVTVSVLRSASPNPRVQTPQAAPPEGRAYVVGSWFLRDCHTHLLASPNGHERLHFVTGLRLAAARTLDRMVPVAIESQSAIHATADQRAAQKVLIEMDEWGHTVHGLFHSHPGRGREATKPSSTDLATHERYERGGYPLVGAIFVQDGYVRFFSAHRHDFTIHLYGKGVEQLNAHLFKISNI